MKFIFTFFLFVTGLNFCLGQTVPVHPQYILNQYLYNPAAVGISGEHAINFGLTKQWLGIDGSPSMGVISYENPFHEKMSLGANLINSLDGPFNDLSFYATFAYKLELQEEMSIRFGLSAGMDYYNVNTSKFDDPSDPAIANMTVNEINYLMNFGLSFNWGNLQTGASFPTLIGSPYIFESDDNPSNDDPLNYFILTGNYSLPMGKSWAIDPHILYHRFADFNDQVEGMVEVSWKNRISAGGGYRTNFGPNFMISFKANDKLKFGYFYLPGNDNLRLNADTHALQCRLTL